MTVENCTSYLLMLKLYNKTVKPLYFCRGTKKNKSGRLNTKETRKITKPLPGLEPGSHPPEKCMLTIALKGQKRFNEQVSAPTGFDKAKDHLIKHLKIAKIVIRVSLESKPNSRNIYYHL